MRFSTLLVREADGVAFITVNRPEKRNALNAELRSELVAAMRALESSDSVRVIVITGAGEKAFIAGADINEFAQRTPLEQREAMQAPRVFDVVAECAKPVIAMINGLAMGGGCELALACDIRIAASSAKLGQPEIRLGLIPGGGGTQRLPRLTGMGQAMRLVLGGEAITAQEALRIGLVDEVCADEQLEARTMQLAQTIAAHSPVALRLAKAALRAAAEQPLHAGLDYERELFITAFSSDDRKEGVSAFLEKRGAQFRGR